MVLLFVSPRLAPLESAQMIYVPAYITQPANYPALLNVQSRSLALGQRRLVRLKSVLHLSRGELLHLLGSTADESARVKECIELAQNGSEE